MGLRFPASRRIYLTRVAGTSHGAASEVTPRGPALALVRATYGMASCVFGHYTYGPKSGGSALLRTSRALPCSCSQAHTGLPCSPFGTSASFRAGLCPDGHIVHIAAYVN
jgi:hypothetical protein